MLLRLFFTSNSAVFVGEDAKIVLSRAYRYPCYATDHAMSALITS